MPVGGGQKNLRLALRKAFAANQKPERMMLRKAPTNRRPTRVGQKRKVRAPLQKRNART